MKLAVVILNWNQAAETAACARSVGEWSRLKPDVWIADNGSADVEALARACPAARLLRSPVNRGFAGGNNLAIGAILEGPAELVLLLNNDADVTEAAAEALIRTLDEHPEIGIIGPVLIETGGAQEVRLAGGRDIAWHVNTRTRAPAPEGAGALRSADYVPGTVFLARTAVFRKIGLLDEAYFFSGEIADLCRRARAAGDGCAVRLDVEARHRREPSAPLRETLYAYYTLRNRFLYIRKHFTWQRVPLTVLWSGLGLLLGLRARLQGRPRTGRAIGLALRDGLRGRFGDRNSEFLSP